MSSIELLKKTYYQIHTNIYICMYVFETSFFYSFFKDNCNYCKYKKLLFNVASIVFLSCSFIVECNEKFAGVLKFLHIKFNTSKCDDAYIMPTNVHILFHTQTWSFLYQLIPTKHFSHARGRIQKIPCQMIRSYHIIDLVWNFYLWILSNSTHMYLLYETLSCITSVILYLREYFI